MAKIEARATVRRALQDLSGPDRRLHEERIAAFILSLAAYRHAEQILAYWALTDEVSLASVLESADEQGKAVFIPAFVGEGLMEYRRWWPGAPMGVGLFGVAQPVAEGGPPGNRPSLSLIPGRAFDTFGNRLGRGKGYYDRVMPRMAALGPLLGVAFGIQILEQIPIDCHDFPVDAVVTETGIHRTARWMDRE